MTVGPFIFELLIVLLLSVGLLHHYGRIRRQHPIVTIATLTSWYFSLIIIFILPLDVSSAFYRQCLSQNAHPTIATTTTISSTIETQHNNTNTTNLGRQQRSEDKNVTPLTICEEPYDHVPDITLQVMWRIVYWSSQLLTWIILPFMQSYSYSGEFTPSGKVKHALLKNAVYYGTYLAIVIALLVYVAANPKLRLDFSQLKVICITASNTWGLFLLVLLLGYGLVEFPRSVWNSSNPFVSIAYTHFKLAKLSTEKQEAMENLEDLLEQIKDISNSVRYNHPLRKYVNMIISKCPDEFQDKVSQGMDDYEDYDDGSRSRSEPTEKMLTSLHGKIIRAMQTKQRTTVQWDINMRTALHLDNVIKNKKQTVRVWVEETVNESSEKSWFSQVFCQPTVRWYWECVLRGIVFKILAICLVVLSFMVIWSECTFFNDSPVLSLFAIFLNHAGANYNYFYIELASFCIISYMCVCAYYTVFRIKFFNYYYIAGHHQTNEISLMFVGIMLCRLTPPLCLNFLGLIHLDAHVASNAVVDHETFYTKIMGHLVVIPIISKGFNIYFPILMVVLCIATYFSLGHRCLSAIGFQQFISGNMSDEFTADLVEEGRQLVNREKRKQMREFKHLSRRGNGMSSDSDSNIKSRQWQGRVMREVDMTKKSKKNDKFELLNDAEDMDYSTINNEEEDENIISGSSSGSRWNRTPSSQWSNNRTFGNNRPPSNIFDDM